MGPEEIDQRAVRVGLLVGMLVVTTVDRDPARRGVLQAAKPQDRQRVLEPFRTSEAAMGEQPMVTEVNAEHAEHIVAYDRKDDAGPAEKPRRQRQQREQMVADKESGGKPGDAAKAYGCWQRQRVRAGRHGPRVNSLAGQGPAPPGTTLGSRTIVPISLCCQRDVMPGRREPGYQGARPMT